MLATPIFSGLWIVHHTLQPIPSICALAGDRIDLAPIA